MEDNYFNIRTSSAPSRRSTFTPTSPSSCRVSRRSTRASPTFRSRMLTLGRKGRQDWLRKHKRLFGSGHAQAEASFNQEKDRTRRPSLRSAGYRLKGWGFTSAPGKAAKEFRQTMQIEEKTGVEQSCEDHRGRLLESVSAEPCRD